MINVCPVDMKKLLQRPDFVYDIKVKSNNLEKMPLPSSNSFDGILKNSDSTVARYCNLTKFE